MGKAIKIAEIMTRATDDLAEDFSLTFSRISPSPIPEKANMIGIKIDKLRLITSTAEPINTIRKRMGVTRLENTKKLDLMRKKAPMKNKINPIPGSGMYRNIKE